MPSSAITRRLAIVLALAFGAAGCGGTLTSPDVATAVPTTSMLAPTPSAMPATASVAPTSALEGTWATDVIAPSDVEASLEREGLGEWIDAFRSQSPLLGDTKLVLVIEGGQWNLYGERADGQREPIDFDAEYAIDGDTVAVFHGEGSRRLGWSVEGDTLTIKSRSTTLSPSAGIPDEVFQVALYTTSSFDRQDP
jgi:hypothetical protein